MWVYDSYAYMNVFYHKYKESTVLSKLVPAEARVLVMHLDNSEQGVPMWLKFR